MKNDINEIISVLIECCDRVESALADYALRDDASGVYSLHRQFDDGKAIVSLVIEHTAPETRRLSLRLTGLRDGEPAVVAVSDFLIGAKG